MSAPLGRRPFTARRSERFPKTIYLSLQMAIGPLSIVDNGIYDRFVHVEARSYDCWC